MCLFKFISIIAGILYLLHVVVEARVRVVKYVYQKDMSEHCRRRVMPSVFLGQNVVDANSQILHFSQLEVPYSCLISIRTESGGNIILVIKLDSHPSGCSEDRSDGSPVKVFGMGETFGGYWGPLPDTILSASTPMKEKFYTLKTTKATRDIVINESDEDSQSDGESSESQQRTTPLQPATRASGEIQDYIRQMIPIVNISGRLVKTNKEPQRAFAADDTFDLFYNVKRDPEKKYVSTVVPLMQFSVAEGTVDERRSGGDVPIDDNATTPEQRFDFEYDFGAFTLDPRLIFPLSGTKPVLLGKKYHPSYNKRINFKKNKEKLFEARASPANSETNLKNQNQTWSFIEGLLRNLTDSNLEEIEKENQSESERFSALLDRVANWQHNYSAYLAPNSTLIEPLFLDKLQQINQTSEAIKAIDLGNTMQSRNYEKKNEHKATTKKLSTARNHMHDTEITSQNSHSNPESLTRIIKVSAGTPSLIPKSYEIFTEASIKDTSGLFDQVTEAVSTTIQKIKDSVTGVTDTVFNVGSMITEKTVVVEDHTDTNGDSSFQTTTSSSQSRSKDSEDSTIKSSLLTGLPVKGSIRNHASWENVVQVAPKIAGILQHTETYKTFANLASRKRHRRRRRRHRRRRSIQAIQIELARPHNLTTDPDIMTTPEEMYNFADIQDFAQLVELQDDEIPGHLALRYMRRFVGPTLFDLCSNQQDRATQHVLFFNTSRIVLALNNFTLKRMTVIATPARWLPFAGQRCNVNSLECQVAGKRVCVNKLTACDGVPNCGAMDIYDEDRLQCGADTGLKHNVYLAAFTFLAVLLTMLYTVHYWLKRCVPKVSEAFFIYTDGTENILYLDSIMRSPLDNDMEKSMFHSNYFEDVSTIDHRILQKKQGIFKKFFTYCCCKKKLLDDFEMVDMDLMIDGSKARAHAFSFPEIEINNLTNSRRIEIAVQTGDSLEMRCQSDMEDIDNTFYFAQLNAAAQRATRQRQESIDPRAAIIDVRIVNESEEEIIARRNSENSELSMLKFLREAKLSSEFWSRTKRPAAGLREESYRETELNSTIYDRSTMTLESSTIPLKSMDLPPAKPLKDYQASTKESSIPLVGEEPLAEPGPSLPVTGPRRIRFNDNLTIIPQEEEDVNLNHESSQVLAQVDLEQENSPGSSGRDFRRFWTSNKNKKDKGKQKKHLPMH